jgi:hypothetical protein
VQAEHGLNEEKSRECRDQQAADDRTPERGVLLAAFSHRQRLRQHAYDHGESRHQHWTKTGEPGVKRRRCRVIAVPELFAREAEAAVTCARAVSCRPASLSNITAVSPANV